MIGKLRQQGGALVLTLPNAIAAQLGWSIGNILNIEKEGERVILSPVTRQPRGRKNIAQLLDGIDSQEISELNASVSDMLQTAPQGNEIW